MLVYNMHGAQKLLPIYHVDVLSLTFGVLFGLFLSFSHLFSGQLSTV